MNTTELKKLAEAATLGPWKASDRTHIYTNDLRLVAVAQHCRESVSNAAYIAAANPAAILELLAINAELVEALKDAATSLETIHRLAGRPYYGRDEQGPIPTNMGEMCEVRQYALSRAGCTRAALAKAEGGEL